MVPGRATHRVEQHVSRETEQLDRSLTAGNQNRPQFWLSQNFRVEVFGLGGIPARFSLCIAPHFLPSVSRETSGPGQSECFTLNAIHGANLGGAEAGFSENCQDAIEITDCREIYSDLAFSCAKMDFDPGIETISEVFSDLIEVPLAPSGQRLHDGFLGTGDRRGFCRTH